MNFIKIRYLLSLTALCLFLLTIGCAPKVTVKKDSEESPQAPPRISTIKGDTISYSIEFYDTKEREKFIETFGKFLKEYPFAKLQSNADDRVFVQILPVKGATSGDKQAGILSDQRKEYVGSVIKKTVDASQTDSQADSQANSITPTKDSVVPVFGGSVKIFTQRGALDETFSSLVDMNPFENRYGTSILTIADSSPKKVVFHLNGKIINGKGKVLSALDFIDNWTTLIKTHPAEGFALFRYVEGIKEFTYGTEAIVRGFLASDQSTIQLRLTQADTLFLTRLRSSRLLFSNFKLGEYFIDVQNGDEFTLLSNKASGRKSGFLDKLFLKTGGDPNPVLSYSLKKFDAVTLVTNNDLDYSRQNLIKNGTLSDISKDRYFLTCNNSDPSFRKYLKSIVKPSDLLKNFIKADGELITSITDIQSNSDQNNSEIIRPGVTQPVKILFRKDDPVSKIIAEKLLADLTQDNLPGALNGVSLFDYEKALIGKNYGCAIGWVSEKVLNDPSEKLRLSTIWFNDENNESTRISTGQELPLFSINRYILTRNPIVVPDSKIEEIFIKQ